MTPTLSQTPGARKMRRYRANRRARIPAKPPGRPADLARHAKLVRAFDMAESGYAGTVEGLVERFGYAHVDSLRKGVKRARAALSMMCRHLSESAQDDILSFASGLRTDPARHLSGPAPSVERGGARG